MATALVENFQQLVSCARDANDMGKFVYCGGSPPRLVAGPWTEKPTHADLCRMHGIPTADKDNLIAGGYALSFESGIVDAFLLTPVGSSTLGVEPKDATPVVGFIESLPGAIKGVVFAQSHLNL